MGQGFDPHCIGPWMMLMLNIQHQCACGAKTAVYWPSEGCFELCKGQNPSEYNGLINGQGVSVPNT